MATFSVPAQYSTIPAALAAVGASGAGHTVEVSAGTYTDPIDSVNLTFPRGSSWASPFTLRAKAGHLVKIAISGELNMRLFDASPFYAIVDGITFDGQNLLQNSSQVFLGSSVGGGNYVRFRNCEWINNQRTHAVFVGRFSHHNELITNLIHGGAWTYTLAGSAFCYPIYNEGSDGLFDGNELYDFPSWGYHAYSSNAPSPSRNVYRNNRVHDYGFGDVRANGVLISSGDANQVVDNYIWNSNGRTPIAIGAAATNTIEHGNSFTMAPSYPIQFGQPFRQGHAQSPVCAIGGTAIPTQVNVTTRWPDNSVKHAIFSVILTGNVNDLVTLGFVEGTPLGTTPGPSISFDAAIELFNVQQLKSNIAGTVYISGPLATTYIHVDHTGAHDLQGISATKCRPIFEVTHWHTQGKAEVRFKGECTNIAALGQCGLGDLARPMRLLINGAAVYTLSGREWFDQMMAYSSRFSRVFWVGGTPATPQIIKHDVAYIGQTGASHTFDPSVVVTEAAVAAMYSQWQSAVSAGNTQILKPGLWNKAMGNAGASDYIGPWTTWVMLWLYTGDRRMREVCEGQADLACHFPMHYRENGAAGDFYSVENHPACQLLGVNSNLARSGVTKVDDLDSWGWNPDTSHQPDHYFPMYLLTGKFFYLEQALFWASWSCAFYNHAATASMNGCGPTGVEGGIPGMGSVTIRGQAWVFRSRCEVASWAPDTMLVKAYFQRLVNSCIAIWEGERSITSTVNNSTANWNWGRSINPISNPLHYWEDGRSAFVINENGTPNGDVDPSRCSTALSTWEQNFLELALIRGLELGFATGPLISWLGTNVQGVQDNLDWKIASNRSPIRAPSTAFFTTWAEVEAVYNDAWAAGEGYTYQGRFQEKIPDLNHGYTNIALAAAKAFNLASAFMLANANPNFTSNPKWAILARTLGPPPPPDPPIPTPLGNAAAFVNQFVPPAMLPGQIVSVSLTFKNIGDTSWTSAGNYFLGGQNPVDSTVWIASSRVGVTGTVAPQAEYTFTFNVTAPLAEDDYDFQWQMVQQGVEHFGALSENIVVTVETPAPETPPDPPSSLTVTM